MDKTPELLLKFDDIVRCFTILLDTSSEREFLRYLKHLDNTRSSRESTIECQRLKTALDAANKNSNILSSKLIAARKLMDTELNCKRKTELDRNSLQDQLQELRKILLKDPQCYKIPYETLQKLSFLNGLPFKSLTPKNINEKFVTVGEESDCTSSLLSESSFSFSEDNLDDSIGYFKNKKQRPSSIAFADENCDTVKRKKNQFKDNSLLPSAPEAESMESFIDAGTPFTPKHCIRNENEMLKTPIIQQINTQKHSFVAYNSILRHNCIYCDKKSGYVRNMWKCKRCNAVAHTECLEKVPLPCIMMGTPKKGTMNKISTYAPINSPMIPAIIVHCVNEVELRGLAEIGLYKISGSEAGMQTLKEKFQKGRGVPNLREESIHDITSYLKNFLLSLYEPLVTRSAWNTFAQAVGDPEKRNRLYNAISLLPQPNRDTMAFLILHLKTVSQSQCKVSADCLAEVFAPILVGFPEDKRKTENENSKMAKVILLELLDLPSDYWHSLITFSGQEYKTASGLRTTPSVESLTKKCKSDFTPGGRRKFFNTSQK